MYQQAPRAPPVCIFLQWLGLSFQLRHLFLSNEKVGGSPLISASLYLVQVQECGVLDGRSVNGFVGGIRSSLASFFIWKIRVLKTTEIKRHVQSQIAITDDRTETCSQIF